MTKYIIPFIFSMLAFALIVLVLDPIKTKPNEIVLELDAVVLENDILQAFYLQDGMEQFTEQQSTTLNVIGKAKAKKYNLCYPLICQLKY